MAGGMAFRKDCADCGRSFLTPDRKAKLCPGCSGKARKLERPPNITPSKTPTAARASEIKPSSTVVATRHSVPADSEQTQSPPPKISTQPKAKRFEKTAQKNQIEIKGSGQGPDTVKSPVALTDEQTREIIGRYQAYVQTMKRPPIGRRKTIAAELGIPNRTVVLALRTWNQAQGKELTREERFSVEKAYFSYLGTESSFDRLQERICIETGLDLWPVCRHLDVLHDGEEKLKKIPEVSPEQKTAILTEYINYLTASAPPGPSLHPMIAEKTGVSPKQVHKILLTYRLDKFREQWPA